MPFEENYSGPPSELQPNSELRAADAGLSAGHHELLVPCRAVLAVARKELTAEFCALDVLETKVVASNSLWPEWDASSSLLLANKP